TGVVSALCTLATHSTHTRCPRDLVEPNSFSSLNETPSTEIYPLSLHDALPIFGGAQQLQRQPHVRGLEELRQAFVGALASQPGLLHAAEGGRRVGGDPDVHRYDACLQALEIGRAHV